MHRVGAQGEPEFIARMRPRFIVRSAILLLSLAAGAQGFISVRPPSPGRLRATQGLPALSRRASSHEAVLALRASRAAELWGAACEENGVPQVIKVGMCKACIGSGLSAYRPRRWVFVLLAARFFPAPQHGSASGSQRTGSAAELLAECACWPRRARSSRSAG